MQTVKQEQEQESLGVDKRSDSLAVALRASSNRRKTIEEVNSIYVHICVQYDEHVYTHNVTGR